MVCVGVTLLRGAPVYFLRRFKEVKMVRMVRIVRIVRMVWMVTMVTMVVIFYEVRLSRTCFLISRRRSKPQCGSINLCNPFARSAGIF